MNAAADTLLRAAGVTLRFGGVVMKLADRVAVLDFGRKIADAPPAAVQVDSHVIDA